VVLEARDSGWMIVEKVNDMVEDGIERRHQMRLRLKLGDNGYTLMGWFIVYHMKGSDIIHGKCSAYDKNGIYHIDY